MNRREDYERQPLPKLVPEHDRPVSFYPASRCRVAATKNPGDDEPGVTLLMVVDGVEQPIGFDMGIEQADELIRQLIAARNDTWPHK